jgi:hypothetical protein
LEHIMNNNANQAGQGGKATPLPAYLAERDKAAAESIANSAAARRKGRHQDLCDGGYEVLER